MGSRFFARFTIAIMKAVYIFKEVNVMVELFWIGFCLAFGWKAGSLLFEWLRDFILDAPDGIREIRRYQKRRQRRIRDLSRQ